MATTELLRLLLHSRTLLVTFCPTSADSFFALVCILAFPLMDETQDLKAGILTNHEVGEMLVRGLQSLAC